MAYFSSGLKPSTALMFLEATNYLHEASVLYQPGQLSPKYFSPIWGFLAAKISYKQGLKINEKYNKRMKGTAQKKS